MTIQEALNTGTEAIGRRDTQLLLSHITGQSLTGIVVNNNQPLDETAIGAFFAAVDRRKAKEPLQYILGAWEFMGLNIKTDPRALIPRPETELLVEEALAHICKLERPARVLDICTGSGCIAVAVAKLSNAVVTAVDISPDALALAAENVNLHRLTEKIKLVQSDLFDGLQGQTFDVIISNPPYIPANELCRLQTEIRSHEPMLALDGGPDGMDIYRRLIPRSLDFLAPGGALFLEIGPPAVETIMSDAGYDIVSRVRDYAGLDRILVGQGDGSSVTDLKWVSSCIDGDRRTVPLSHPCPIQLEVKYV